MPVSVETRLNNVLQSINDNGFSLSDVVEAVIFSKDVSHQDVQTTLKENSARFVTWLLTSEETREHTLPCTVDAVIKILCDEVLELSQERSGLHFGAMSATSSQLEDSFMRTLAQKIKKIAPNLFRLIFSLLDANPTRRRHMNDAELDALVRELDEELDEEPEQDLGDIGGDDDTAMDQGDNGELDEGREKPHKRRCNAGKWNAELVLIVRNQNIALKAKKLRRTTEISRLCMHLRAQHKRAMQYAAKYPGHLCSFNRNSGKGYRPACSRWPFCEHLVYRKGSSVTVSRSWYSH